MQISPESRRLLNPPFLAAINASAAAGFLSESQQALPLLYSFIVPAMVLHKETRDRLPKVVTTKMPSWAQENAAIIAFLPSHMADLQHLVRESLVVGANVGLLDFDDARDLLPGDGVSPQSLGSTAMQSAEVPEIFKRSHFVGRWLTTAGNPPTVFSVLGVGLRHATS